MQPADRSGVSLGDFVNRLHWDGRDYIAVGTASQRDVRFGERLGRVRCRVSDSLTPMPYTFRDGDAALLPAGTPVHAVRGYRVSEALGADFAGERWLFRASGRTTGVPAATQRQPAQAKDRFLG